ncbi:MAG: inner membrane CreD family protein, partial [Rhodanobacteraceae bacterium]
MVSRPFQGATFKVLGIALLALLMLIPLAQVNDLVREREGRAHEATRQIAERWGASQLVGAPVLVVPVRRQVIQDKTLTTVEEREYLLADRAAIGAKLAPELRRYGIYETAVYTADLAIEGRFRASDIAALAAPGIEPQWQRAELRVPIADVRGIRRVSALHFGDREIAFGPGANGVGCIAAISAPAALDPAALGDQVAFSFTMTLAGTERFAVLPLARETDLHVQSAWPDPGFDG